MIDEVRMALTALRTRETPVPGDLAVVQIDSATPALLGLDDYRRPHLLLRLDGPAVAPRPEVSTLEVGTRSLMIGGTPSDFLDVTCLFEAVAEVFEHFIVAVLDTLTRGAAGPVAALTEVLEKWRRFLMATGSPPGRDKLAAVFGELTVLREIVEADSSRRIDAWVGPFGGRHDFRRATDALEIKTTRSHTGRRVTIHGEDQLEAPAEGSLHLQLIRLEEVPDGGASVSSLVDRLLSLGVPAEALFGALAAGGLALLDLAASAEVTFDVRERLTVPVDEGTPRIVPSSFIGGTRPTGIVDLNYVIDLDHVADRALGASAYTDLVGRLAGVA